MFHGPNHRETMIDYANSEQGAQSRRPYRITTIGHANSAQSAQSRGPHYQYLKNMWGDIPNELTKMYDKTFEEFRQKTDIIPKMMDALISDMKRNNTSNSHMFFHSLAMIVDHDCPYWTAEPQFAEAAAKDILFNTNRYFFNMLY